MPEQITQEETIEVTTQVVEDYGMQLPEYVVRRLARFLLPKYRRICSGMNKNCSDGSKAALLPSVHLKIKIKIDMIGAKEESYERSDLCPLLIGSTAGRIH